MLIHHHLIKRQCMAFGLFFIVFLILGCAPSYQYIPSNSSDPTLFFSEQFTQNRLVKPSFFVASWEKFSEKQCVDIIKIGNNTNNIRVPAGKIIGVTAHDGRSNEVGFTYSCSPPGRVFLAEPNKSYSVDIETLFEAKRVAKCRLKIIQKDTNHELSLEEAPLLVCKTKTN